MELLFAPFFWAVIKFYSHKKTCREPWECIVQMVLHLNTMFFIIIIFLGAQKVGAEPKSESFQKKILSKNHSVFSRVV